MSGSVSVSQDQHEKLRLALMAEGRHPMAARTDEAALAEAKARLTASASGIIRAGRSAGAPGDLD